MTLKCIRFLTFCLLLVACGDDDVVSVDGGSVSDTSVGDGSPPGDGGPNCGNGRIDPGEACDGADLGGQGCADFDLEGTLSCTDACTFDQGDCSSPGCTAGRRECNGTCVDLNASQFNCGACGVVCGEENYCDGGVCTCPTAGQVECGGACVNLNTSQSNCGACGVVCSGDNHCSDGVCTCPTAGEVECDGACVNPNTSSSHCGACGVICGEDTYCNAGTCTCSGADNLLCGGACVPVSNENCGACGNDCGATSLCVREGSTGPWGCADIEVRISDRGLLEAGIGDDWRGVCGDDFDENEGQVACRQLGHHYHRFVTDRTGPDGAFWLDDLHCRGDEASIFDCPRDNPVGREDCGANDWVQLVCQEEGSGTVRAPGGFLTYNEGGEWLGICASLFDENSGRVACREMGLDYESHTVGTGPHNRYADATFVCDGTEDTLAECQVISWGCSTLTEPDRWVRLTCVQPGT